MNQDFTHTTLGRTGLRVHRLGLSASYYPGKATIRLALDRGINFFFGFGIDVQMTAFARSLLKEQRDSCLIATGAYNLLWGHPNLRRSLEKRLRQFGTDHIDLFMFLGVMKEKDFPEKTREELCRLREEGKVRFVGMSCHDRVFAGTMAENGELDVLMIRYNAAHRGAEQQIFPHLAKHNPGIVSYTATRWHYLLQRPAHWPKEQRIPSAGDCYRFVLSNPSVHVCLTAPTNSRQLVENLAALEAGPMHQEEMNFMRAFGDVVHGSKKWFMESREKEESVADRHMQQPEHRPEKTGEERES